MLSKRYGSYNFYFLIQSGCWPTLSIFLTLLTISLMFGVFLRQVLFPPSLSQITSPEITLPYLGIETFLDSSLA
jgi:hypothetical protein